MSPEESHLLNLKGVLSAWGLEADTFQMVPLNGGLINHTWRILGKGKDFILQRINDSIFKDPEKIDRNLSAISVFLKKTHPDYLFVAPIRTSGGKGIYYEEGTGYFRIFPFVPGSHTIDVVENTKQAEEAASQFGLFTRNLAVFPLQELEITLPHFHDLGLRYSQYLQSLKGGNTIRIQSCSRWTEMIAEQNSIVETYEYIKKNPSFKQRVTHHDTKISNILFGPDNRGLCVIDLDTVMPGYFISDLGDMFRTYLPQVSEEESEFTRIDIREDFFAALIKGYLGQMQDELTAAEKESFVYAAKFGIFLQAIRFLTDYFNNDIYYGARYPNHNLIRAGNQLTLLQRLIEKEPVRTEIQGRKI